VTGLAARATEGCLFFPPSRHVTGSDALTTKQLQNAESRLGHIRGVSGVLSMDPAKEDLVKERECLGDRPFLSPRAE
jgi:hypothetical protein